MTSLRKLFFGYIKAVVGIFILSLYLLLLLVLSGIWGKNTYIFMSSVVIYIVFMGIVFFLLAIYSIVVLNSISKAKSRLRNITNFDEGRFEREANKAPKMKNIIVCSDAICFYGNGNLINAVPIQDIVWAYQEVDKSIVYLSIYLRDQTKFRIPILIKKRIGTKEMACRYILRLIARKAPGVLIGYEEEYETMAKKDFNELIARISKKEITDSRILEQEYVKNNYYVKDFC